MSAQSKRFYFCSQKWPVYLRKWLATKISMRKNPNDRAVAVFGIVVNKSAAKWKFSKFFGSKKSSKKVFPIAPKMGHFFHYVTFFAVGEVICIFSGTQLHFQIWYENQSRKKEFLGLHRGQKTSHKQSLFSFTIKLWRFQNFIWLLIKNENTSCLWNEVT